MQIRIQLFTLMRKIADPCGSGTLFKRHSTVQKNIIHAFIMNLHPVLLVYLSCRSCRHQWRVGWCVSQWDTCSQCPRLKQKQKIYINFCQHFKSDRTACTHDLLASHNYWNFSEKEKFAFVREHLSFARWDWKKLVPSSIIILIKYI